MTMTDIDTEPVFPECEDGETWEERRACYDAWYAEWAPWNARRIRREKSFAGFDAQLTGRCHERRKIANNTWLERRGPDTIVVRLHQTDIITYHRDGRIVFNTGGWYTVTTKERMNRFSPCTVWANRGRWYIALGFIPWGDRTAERRITAYADGITLMPDDTFAGAPSDDERLREDREVARIKRDIRAFVNSITAEQIVHAFENTGGDCLICRIAAQNEDMSGFGGGCLDSHVEERYFHAHLAYRAIKARGYSYPDTIMQMVYSAAQHGRVDNLLTENLAKFLRKKLITGRQTR